MVFFKRKISVLFVCTENLCRSPIAEGLLRHYLKTAGLEGKVRVGSAGTIAGRPGAKPDARAIKLASESGIALGKIRARRVSADQLASCDLIIALDSSHYDDLVKICPWEGVHKISLLLDYLPGSEANQDVPDPYYGSSEGFKEVFQLIDRAVLGMLPRIGDLAAAI